MAKVTVAVPIYNAEKYLENCIKSVINQSFKDIQILLINDGSSDQSGEICDRYQLKDPRIKVYHNSNQGVSNTRNFAINKSDGKYICFVDADDEIDTYMVQTLHEYIENEDADMVICGHKSVYLEHKNKQIVKHNPPEFNGSIIEFLERIEEFLNTESVQGPCGKIFKTELIKKNKIQFPKKLSFGEDTIFVYSYLSCSKKIVSIEKCFYSYMKRNNNSLSASITQDKVKIFINLYDDLQKLLNKFNIYEKQNLIEKKICLAAVSCIDEIYQTNRKLSAKKRIEFISNIFSNERVIECFFKQTHTSKRYKLIGILVQKRLFRLLELLFRLKTLIKTFRGISLFQREFRAF
ncbi:glycosyltransferase family 2 protein [Bacillus sp. V33-4]|uniref:glycosyltransferase family 2 protein n=1 Tax=Bacillus sp. V33-4 TaxID=2054169 RepID=UPI000C7698C5|nr:glycosyltransferase family 2 protein [Bacillus sp. V33-4]PLR85412.1 hypothetical protein CVD23_08525 [Bacillus sp. V33-4]